MVSEGSDPGLSVYGSLQARRFALPRPTRSRASPMRIAILTNEYPPYIYGGAGVHVEYLTRELTRVEGGQHTVEVVSFGDQDAEVENLKVRGVQPAFELPAQDPKHKKFLDTM